MPAAPQTASTAFGCRRTDRRRAFLAWPARARSRRSASTKAGRTTTSGPSSMPTPRRLPVEPAARCPAAAAAIHFPAAGAFPVAAALVVAVSSQAENAASVRVAAACGGGQGPVVTPGVVPPAAAALVEKTALARSFDGGAAVAAGENRPHPVTASTTASWTRGRNSRMALFSRVGWTRLVSRTT